MVHIGVSRFPLKPLSRKGFSHCYFCTLVRLTPVKGRMSLLIAVIIVRLPMSNFTFVFWTLGGTVLYC